MLRADLAVLGRGTERAQAPEGAGFMEGDLIKVKAVPFVIKGNSKDSVCCT